MTNIFKKERKGKGLLYLIAIAVLIAIMSIACKNKPTALAEFIEEPEAVNTTETLTPTGQLSIDKTKAAFQYDGNKFISKKYKDSTTGTEFQYEISITALNDAANGTILTFTGYEKGSKFSREYLFPGYQPGRGDSYYQYNEGGSGVLRLRSGGGADTAKVRFYNDSSNLGWAQFQPANYGFTITLALNNATS